MSSENSLQTNFKLVKNMVNFCTLNSCLLLIVLTSQVNSRTLPKNPPKIVNPTKTTTTLKHERKSVDRPDMDFKKLGLPANEVQLCSSMNGAIMCTSDRGGKGKKCMCVRTLKNFMWRRFKRGLVNSFQL